MTTLDSRFERALRELDDSLPQQTPHPIDQFRRRHRRRRAMSAAATGMGATIVALGGLLALTGGRATDPEPGPVATTRPTTTPTAATSTLPARPRVMIATDLFAKGFGWLDGRNFDEPTQVGPFDVFEFEDDTEPAYWYYKGMGVVPIGTRYDPTATGETSTGID